MFVGTAKIGRIFGTSKKINDSIKIIVEHDGLPRDGDWCIVVYEGENGSVEWFIGGYVEERKYFYADYGYGGAVLDADKVVGWTYLLEDAHWDRGDSKEQDKVKYDPDSIKIEIKK